MLRFEPAAYRPPVSSPRIGQYGHPYYSPLLGFTFDEKFKWTPLGGDFARLVGHAGCSWLGFYVATTGKGFITGVGWVLGFATAIAAICDAISVVQRLSGMHPPDPETLAQETSVPQTVAA